MRRCVAGTLGFILVYYWFGGLSGTPGIAAEFAMAGDANRSKAAAAIDALSDLAMAIQLLNAEFGQK